MTVDTREKTYRRSFDAYENVRNDWFEPSRLEAFRRLSTVGFDGLADGWRAMDAPAVLDAAYEEACEDCLEAVDRKILELHFLRAGAPANRLVFVNGFFSRRFSAAEALPEGALLKDLAAAMREDEALVRPHLGRGLAEETDPMRLVNAFRFADGAFLHVPAGAAVEEPVHFLFVTLGVEAAPIVSYPRALVSLGAGARAKVVVDHVELSKRPHLLNMVTDVALAERASLELLELERAEGHGAHFFSKRARLGAGASFDDTRFSQGGLLTRSEVFADLAGEGASASLKGVGVLKGASRAFVRAAARHLVPGCRSRQFFKNVLAGTSRAEFDSFVYVAPGCPGSDSRQLNKNLLLSDRASALTRPQLKILTDDVSAAHGATVGRLDENELFYLRTRGLDRGTARTLLIRGFADEVLEEVRDADLRDRVEALVDRELGGTDGLG